MSWTDNGFVGWKPTLVWYSRLLLDATNRPDSCHKSGQIRPKFWPEPDLAGFAKNGQMPDLPEPEPKSGTSLLRRSSLKWLILCWVECKSLFNLSQWIMGHETGFCRFWDIHSVLWCCWLGGRKGIQFVKNLSGGMLALLCVWDKVDICIWPSWCQCHSLSLAPVNPDWYVYLPVLPFWCRFTWVIPDKIQRALKWL